MISVAPFVSDPQCHLEHQRSHSSWRLLIQKCLFCERLIRLGSVAYHHNTPFISLNHNNMLLGIPSWAWESFALWAKFFGPEYYRVKPRETDTPLPDTRRHPETFQNIVDLHKHSYTLKTSSTAGLNNFVVKNLHDWKIILKISYRHFISGHLNHSEVSSARSSKAQQWPKCISAVLVVNWYVFIE